MNKYIIIGIAIVAFIAGHYIAPKTEIKTIEVEKKTEKTETERSKHKETTTVEVKKPDGTTETTTKTVEDTNTEKTTKTVDNKSKESDTIFATPKTQVYALAGVHASSLGSIDYGLGVSHQVLGPISVGVFGFKSGEFGGTVGIQF